jgi:hypothetical protein
MAAGQGRHNTPLHVLVAVVTAAERGLPMPRRADLAAEIGCVEHNVSMAMLSLERRGVLRRVGDRVLVTRTGAATAGVGE